ncbi:MAG: CidA/LrgA family protein [Muribaculaceae bacterium]|nr:CidA/LrgA family protein [Muribaculaceae bacterium]
MILQIGLIFAFLGLGEIVVALTGIPVPSSIVGMLLLTGALKMRIVRLMWVDKAADFLVKNLGFFFVPAGVGLMRCLGLLRDQWLPIVAATVISTFVIIAVTGWVHQIVRRSSAKLTTSAPWHNND